MVKVIRSISTLARDLVKIDWLIDFAVAVKILTTAKVIIITLIDDICRIDSFLLVFRFLLSNLIRLLRPLNIFSQIIILNAIYLLLKLINLILKHHIFPFFFVEITLQFKKFWIKFIFQEIILLFFVVFDFALQGIVFESKQL